METLSFSNQLFLTYAERALRGEEEGRGEVFEISSVSIIIKNTLNDPSSREGETKPRSPRLDITGVSYILACSYG